MTHTVVTVTCDGKEQIYFRIVDDNGEVFIERPESASISASELNKAATLTEKVVAALEVIEREDDKWHRLKTTGVNFPSVQPS